MVFPLFKTWLRPLIGSSARTTNDNYNKKPDGFRSIGGGGADDSHSRRTRGTNPLTHISFTESEERIVNEIKLQNMKVAAAPVAPGTQPGPISKKGIVVKTEFDIQVSEDGSSQHHAEQKATCVHEPW